MVLPEKSGVCCVTIHQRVGVASLRECATIVNGNENYGPMSMRDLNADISNHLHTQSKHKFATLSGDKEAWIMSNNGSPVEVLHQYEQSDSPNLALVSSLTAADYTAARRAENDRRQMSGADLPPDLRLMNASKGDDTQRVGQYARQLEIDFKQIDKHSKGIITQADLRDYATKRGDLAPEEKEAAQFLLKNYDFVKNLPLTKLQPESSYYRGDGIYHRNLEVLAALTDATAYRSLIRGESFSLLTTFLSAGAYVAALSGISVLAPAELGLSAVAGGLIGTVAGIAILPVAIGGGFLGGYLFYQKSTRQHYEGKRQQLKEILER